MTKVVEMEHNFGFVNHFTIRLLSLSPTHFSKSNRTAISNAYHRTHAVTTINIVIKIFRVFLFHFSRRCEVRNGVCIKIKFVAPSVTVALTAESAPKCVDKCEIFNAKYARQ